MRSPRAAAITSTQRSTAESIPRPSRSILRKPASAQESLSHCTIWRPSIAHGITGQRSTSGSVEMTIPPGCCIGWRGSPAASRTRWVERPPAGRAALAGPARAPRRPRCSSAFQGSTLRASRSISPGGRPSTLAKSRTAPRDLVGGGAAHERRALGPVELVHARDQLLADVAREVEVDVRQRGQLVVEEAPEVELLLHRVDVREAGQVADDRGHARPPPPPRRQERPRRVRPAHLARHLARQLQHLAVEQEEARQAEVADHAQLLLEAACGVAAAAVARRVALLEARAADLGQLAVGRGILGARVAVAEVLGQVEAQPLGQPGGSPPPPRDGRRSARPSPPAAASTCEELPRRSGSHSSSVLPSRTATSASCSGARSRACAWTLPVATVGHPEPLRPARRAGGCGGGRSARTGAGARPAGGRGPKMRSSSLAAAGECTPCRAQPDRQTSPSACASRSASEMLGGVGSPARPRALVRACDQPAEVAVAGPVLAQEREVARRRRASARRR